MIHRIMSSLAVLSFVGLYVGCASAQDGKSAGKAPGQKWENFDAGSFVRSLPIDNPWMPLKPGTRFVYDGTTIEDDGTAVPHRIEIHVTDLTKVIGGVRSLATWDLDFSDGELVEAELAFFAQDSAGNVWRMGEYPEEYDAGKVIASPTWMHGFEDARAGIMMPGNPKLGTPDYSQGWGPAVGWTDRAKVDQMVPKLCVKAGCHENVVVMAETSEAEPNAHQLKSYARGVGNVKTGWRGAGEKTKETLELVKVEQLDAKGMADVRAKALALEKSGYQRSKTVYAHTPPLQQLP
jgi:hypothetical protein